jgi:hypothetical protein
MAIRSLITGEELPDQYVRELINEINDPGATKRDHGKTDTQIAIEIHDLSDSGVSWARTYAAALRDYCSCHVHQDGTPYDPEKLRKLWDNWYAEHGPGPAYRATLKK